MVNKEKIDFRLEAKETETKAIVYLYGDIVDEQPRDWWSGEELEGEFIIPKKVREIFEEIEKDEVELHINSYGGSIFASVSIFNYLKTLDKNITVIVDGLAASGASLIAMAGDKLKMPRNTTLMIHRASSYAWGNCVELRKIADTLEKLDNATVFETYKSKFKGTDEELKNLIDTETWLTAEEAFENGLCDEIIEISNTEPEDMEEIKPEEITNAIRFMTNFANLKLK